MYSRTMISLRINQTTLQVLDQIAVATSGDDLASRVTRSEVIRAAVAVALQYPDEIANQITRTKEQP